MVVAQSNNWRMISTIDGNLGTPSTHFQIDVTLESKTNVPLKNDDSVTVNLLVYSSGDELVRSIIMDFIEDNESGHYRADLALLPVGDYKLKTNLVINDHEVLATDWIVISVKLLKR